MDEVRGATHTEPEDQELLTEPAAAPLPSAVVEPTPEPSAHPPDPLQELYMNLDVKMDNAQILELAKSSGLPYTNGNYKNTNQTKITLTDKTAGFYSDAVEDFIKVNYGSVYNDDFTPHNPDKIEYIEYYNKEKNMYLIFLNNAGSHYIIRTEDEQAGGYFVYDGNKSKYESVSSKSEQFEVLSLK